MKKTLFLFILLLYSTQFFAQTKLTNDSYLKNIEKFGDTNIDSLIYYAKQSQKSKDTYTSTLGVLNEANAYYKKGEYKKSEEICLRVIESMKSITTSSNEKILLSAFNRLFWIKKNQGNYNKAFYYLLEKKKVIETLPKNHSYYYIHKLSANNNIASIKAILGLHNEAISVLKETNFDLKKLQKNNSFYYNHLKVLHSSNLNIIGDSYYTISNDSINSYIDSAAVYYKKAYNIALTFAPKHKNSFQLYSLRKVKVLAKKGLFKKALTTINKTKSKENIQEINYYKTLIHYNLKNSDSTLYFANNFINYYKNTPSTKKHKLVVYDILANQYNTLKKSDSAYKYSKLGLEELTNIDSHKIETNKSYYQYNFDEIQKNNLEIINNKKNKFKLQLIFTICLSIVIITLLAIFFYKKRQKTSKKFNTIIDEIQSSETPPKKDYNIDKDLEKSILYELENLENSDLFLKSDFNINVLAKKLKTNSTYISYIINNTKKQNFKQYITRLRIDYLIEKLNTDEKYQTYTIQFLAEGIGYKNASAFTRAFKKQIGSTPSEYIKALKK